jgi:Zn-dependent protease with chaperone function
MQSFEAHYFDGKSSNPKRVTLELHEDFVSIAELGLCYKFEDIEVRAKLKNTSQTVSFMDGSYCELKDSDFFALPGKNIDNIILKIESKIKYSIASFVVLALFVVFCLTYGSTMLSNMLAPQIPKSAVELISKQSLELLDENYMSKSELDKKKQVFIQKRFNDIFGEEYNFKLHFRKSEVFGANAFALPNGDIILLDDLVQLEKDAGFRGILGILAHEGGHVVHNHGLKLVIKSSVSSAIMGYLIGDFSGFAATFATFAVDAQYSQSFEKEADLYAIEIMKKNGISTKYLADIFENIMKQEGMTQENPSSDSSYKSFISSHPSMHERIIRFRENE